jgi:hypothetical protein
MRLATKISEVEFGRDLADARIVRRGDHTEIAAVDQPAWGSELSVIEQVEKLKAEIEIHVFSEVRFLGQRHVPVIQSGSTEEAALGITELANILKTEEPRIEVRASLPRICLREDVPRRKIRLIGRPGRAYRSISKQRSIVVLLNGDWETCREARNA